MSADKYPSIFSHQMEAIVYISSRRIEAIDYLVSSRLSCYGLSVLLSFILR